MEVLIIEFRSASVLPLWGYSYRHYSYCPYKCSLACQAFARKTGRSGEISVPAFVTIPKSDQIPVSSAVCKGSRIFNAFFFCETSCRIEYKLSKCSLKRTRLSRFVCKGLAR